MINLITGVPGSGKTVYSLVFMLEAYKEGRPIFVHGIPDLQIEHTQVICSSPSCSVCPVSPIEPTQDSYPENESIADRVLKSINRNKYKNFLIKSKQYIREKLKYDSILRAEDWHEWAPDGAFIFYDEVQNVYRPRSSSKTVPASVAAFETHRHKGLDFYLVSQSPLLFDGNIRRLVNKHIHLRPTWAGRYQYEFPECNDSPKSAKGGIKSKYSLNKKVFSLFTSASLHTKQTKKIPAAFYIIFIALFLFLFMLYRITNRYDEKINPVNESITIESDQLDIEQDSTDQFFGVSMLSKWVKRGVSLEDYSFIPEKCVIGKKAIKCPPYSIDTSLLESVNANRLCSNGGACFSFFPLQIASSD